MYRKYMTEEENRVLKRTLRQNAHTGIRMEQLYPSVEKIEIHHNRSHRSAFGSNQKEGVMIVTSKSEACFIIDCLNPECSSIGFDLSGVISTAIHRHLTEFSGEMNCEGQEAPDHPEQSCEGNICYRVTINYR